MQVLALLKWYCCDIEDSYFMPINDQLDYVCRMIHEDKNLSNGLHMIGISQGGLFVRALVQKCNLSKVGTVVSIGGPQQEDAVKLIIFCIIWLTDLLGTSPSHQKIESQHDKYE
ncbi:uncharacterized protein DC041_0007474 [Schistosoma bovis]|uniref:Palmitoyl-protein thioesterase 1 n=1 Tax=Schistosoma bovis TaxID=6184 RepID=A0A430QTJ6_SCHBO|nr:uncharacterized protein DC041_0007474 [Schistosoma bovis]